MGLFLFVFSQSWVAPILWSGRNQDCHPQSRRRRSSCYFCFGSQSRSSWFISQENWWRYCQSHPRLERLEGNRQIDHSKSSSKGRCCPFSSCLDYQSLEGTSP